MTMRRTTLHADSPIAPTLPVEAGSFQPRQSCYTVRKTPPASETSAGILLPESCRESTNEGKVLAAGPGYVIPLDNGGYFSVMYCEKDDLVLFPAHCFEEVEDGVGIVHDEDLLAFIPAGSDEIIPLNDFIKVAVESRRATTSGGLHLADGQKTRPRQGEILDYGPGKLRLKGTYYGTRVSVEQILGLTLPSDGSLRGKVAIWGADAEVLEVGSERAEFLLVRAGDILAFDETEEANDEGDAV